MAQRFDADKLELTGEPFPVAEDVASTPGLGRGAFSVSKKACWLIAAVASRVANPSGLIGEANRLDRSARLVFTSLFGCHLMKGEPR